MLQQLQALGKSSETDKPSIYKGTHIEGEGNMFSTDSQIFFTQNKSHIVSFLDMKNL
jgi:hypothetical protein